MEALEACHGHLQGVLQKISKTIKYNNPARVLTRHSLRELSWRRPRHSWEGWRDTYGRSARLALSTLGHDISR